MINDPLETRYENEINIAGRTILVRATILSILDDREEVEITKIIDITVNGRIPSLRLARKVEEALYGDDGVYEELCMRQPGQDQLMLERAERVYDAKRIERRA